MGAFANPSTIYQLASLISSSFLGVALVAVAFDVVVFIFD
jgi:hypothetical protein